MSAITSAHHPWDSTDTAPYIHIDTVSRRFGEITALDRISLKIYRGELFALLGGSGSGKTTLLRLLAGFDAPDEGRLFIDGVDMADVPPYERPVNMMFQSYALFPHMSVADNIAFGLKQDRLPRGEIRDRVAEMLELVQMPALGRRKPHQLSGGQKQRVALARALVKRPKLLLLDEPLAALDKKLRERTQFELVNIQEKVGITFILVTHDQEEAMTMASRIAIMRDGRLEQLGTPSEIYEYPNSRFTADFIGQVNLFEGVLREDATSHAVIDSPEAGGTIYLDHAVPGMEGATLWVALRPEKLLLSTERPDQPHNCCRGVIDEIGYLGHLSTYHVRLDSGKLVRVTEPNTQRHAEPRLTWEQPVWLSWQAAAAVVLNR